MQTESDSFDSRSATAGSQTDGESKRAAHGHFQFLY